MPTPAKIPNLLSIAGSDPSGGAGVQADLKTFAALGCYAMAAITALTAQNTQGVHAIHVPPAAFLAAQLEALFADIHIDGVKIGMLANADNVGVVAACLARHRPKVVVLDPVLVATSGDSLGDAGVVAAMLQHLAPLASLITPNLSEVARLADIAVPNDTIAMIEAGEMLLASGAEAVLVKGGHLASGPAQDVLVVEEGSRVFSAERIATLNTHGTGCTLSSAIAALLAQGHAMPEAIRLAKHYVTQSLRASDKLTVGRGNGHGPLQHFHALWRKP